MVSNATWDSKCPLPAEQLHGNKMWYWIAMFRLMVYWVVWLISACSEKSYLGQKYNLLPTNYGLNISLLLTTLPKMGKSNWYTTWPKQQVSICTDNVSVQIPVTKWLLFVLFVVSAVHFALYLTGLSSMMLI